VRIENLVLVRAAEKAGDPALDAAAAGGLGPLQVQRAGQQDTVCSTVRAASRGSMSDSSICADRSMVVPHDILGRRFRP
jgi:hypothetical protein